MSYVRVSPVSKSEAVAEWQALEQWRGRCTFCRQRLLGNQRMVCGARACRRERDRVYSAGRRAAQKSGLH